MCVFFLSLTEHDLTKNSSANSSIINLHLKRLCIKFLNNTLQLFRAKNYSYMRSRDRIEIMSQILEVAAAAKNEHSGGATKSRLMFNAFLTHTQLKHYLSILADSGLLQYDSVSKRFKTT